MERLLRRLRDRHADADMQQSGAGVRWRCLSPSERQRQVLHRTTLPHLVWCALAEFANQDGDDSATL